VTVAFVASQENIEYTGERGINSLLGHWVTLSASGRGDSPDMSKGGGGAPSQRSGVSILGNYWNFVCRIVHAVIRETAKKRTATNY